MNTTHAVRAIGYYRVSTGEQVDSGLGLAAQRKAIEDACKHRGWNLTLASEEAVSGKTATDARPALGPAVAALDRGEADVLVVSRLDRLSRSVSDFSALLDRADRHGWAVLILDVGVDTTTPTGRMVAQILVAVADWERGIISARTKEALAAKKATGAILGRPDAPTEVAAELVEMIATLRRDGLTLQAIADRLNADAVPTPRKGRWHAATVARVAEPDYRARERETRARAATKTAARKHRLAAVMGGKVSA